MSYKKVTASNSLQTRYTYEIKNPCGKNFDSDFNPDLSPSDMLQLGVFGGYYKDVDDTEFPKHWFKKTKLSTKGKKDCSLNCFNVCASQPLELWNKKGWINNSHDPRGWFQWYCRYYSGRRIPIEDKRQIKRWRSFRRHAGQIMHNCKPNDLQCRPKQRQALLHWAYDSRNI